MNHTDSIAPAGRADAERLPAAPGRGRLEIARSGARSVVTQAYATSPLRLLTPANHGHAAWIYTSSYGGGLVDGDDVRLDVRVGAGATAFVSTQASSKVYRSPRGSRSETRARVEPGGLLVTWPDPVVPFAGARYRQVQRFDVATGGGLVAVDAVSSGRHASGERWAFVEYRSLIEVTLGGRLLIHDALALRAEDGDLEQRLGRFETLVLIVMAGEPVATAARSLVEEIAAVPVQRRPDRLLTAAPVGEDACVVRAAATSVEEAARTVRQLLTCVSARLGEDPWTRKW